MYNLDAIEAINVDQLVTPLDRILLRSGQLRRTRRSSDLTSDAALAVAASAKRAQTEETMHMRSRPVSSRINVLVAAVCATCLSIATVACLLA